MSARAYKYLFMLLASLSVVCVMTVWFWRKNNSSIGISVPRPRDIVLSIPDPTVPLFRVHVNDKYGYIDRNGNIIIRPSFARASMYFSEGLAAVSDGVLSGFIDQHGHYAIRPQFSDARNFSNGLAAIAISPGKWTFCDHYGKIVNSKYYYSVQDASPRHIIVAELGLLNKLIDNPLDTGVDLNWRKIIRTDSGEQSDLHPSDRNANDDSSAIFSFSRLSSGEYKLDNTDLVVIQYQQESEGRCAVMLAGGKWGFVVRDGSFVSPAVYDFVFPFCNGLASVRVGTRMGYISLDGRIVWEPSE